VVTKTERDGASALDRDVPRAFLFCDLRAYTAFVESRGDAAAADLLDRYRSLVRHAVEETGGAEIRTEGDSFYVVFSSAGRAVRCGVAIVAAALAASRAAPDRPIRVGVGIHAGETVQLDAGPVGSAVNIAARVCAIAKPGEVLVTDTVRSLVRTSIDTSFADAGRHRLKGIAEPIRLYRVASDRRSREASARRRRPATALVLVAAGACVVGGTALITLAALQRERTAGPGASRPEATASSTAAESTPFTTGALAGRLVFVATQQVGVDPYPRSQLYVMDATGGNRRRLTSLTENVTGGAASFDGQSVVFMRSDKSGLPARAIVVPLAGPSRERTWPGPWVNGGLRIGSRIYTINRLAWTPSGDLIVAANGRYEDLPLRLFRIAAADGTPTPISGPDPRLQPGRVDDDDPAVSPDGSSIVFSSAESLWVTSAGGGRRVQITSGLLARQPAWSPDGSHIVFRAQRGEGGPFDLYVVTAEGTAVHPLWTDDETDARPAWSPDGVWIAWTRTIGADRQIWVAHSDGADRHALLTGEGGEQLDMLGWTVAPS
jgi:class 3 adenylate cyclase/dipeptidyl aminopeptidase/acylaminoacyl peptidase